MSTISPNFIDTETSIRETPTRWPLPSPCHGRSPGQHVVQEGRLSLEMRLSLNEADLKSALGNNTNLHFIPHTDANSLHRTGNAVAPLKEKFITKSDPFISQANAAYSHKLTPPYLMNDVNGHQIDLKKLVMARMSREDNMENIGAENHQPVGDAKTPVLDLNVLQTPKLVSSLEIPEKRGEKDNRSLPTKNVEILLQEADASKEDHEINFTIDHRDSPKLRSNRSRRNCKRARDESPDSHVSSPAHSKAYCEASLEHATPRQRRQKISALSDEANRSRQETNQLDREIQDLEAQLSAVSSDNEKLWKLLSYFNACIYEAISADNPDIRDEHQPTELANESLDIADAPRPDNESASDLAREPDGDGGKNRKYEDNVDPPSTFGNYEPFMDSHRLFAAVTPGPPLLASALSPRDSELRAACPLFLSPVEEKYGLHDGTTIRPLPFQDKGEENTEQN